MVTVDPTTPDDCDRPVILGVEATVGVITVKFAPLLACPPAVTTTLPVVAPGGTGTVMLVGLMLVGVDGTPLKVTVVAVGSVVVVKVASAAVSARFQICMRAIGRFVA